jgi:hypothetical protein
MATLLRLYSYLYHFVLTAFLLGISVIALASDAHTLDLPMLPWKGDELAHYLLYGSLIGLLSIILAVTGIFRYLFPFWTVAVLVMMVRGFILQPYTFEGKDQFRTVLILIAGALLAFLSSLTLFRQRRR